MRQKSHLTAALGFLLFACTTGDSKDPVPALLPEPPLSKGEVAVYRTTDPLAHFVLRIDSAFRFEEHFADRGVPYWYRIGTVRKVPGRLSTIYLQTDDADTTFQMDLSGVDSILFGPRYGNRGFYIATDADYNAWVID
ncbi:MAG TPA: hypothetical protein VHK69_16490 [Chitinophagaceae bacterium]|jgi:hypothetical protein|nr:hypothetical protein [Chitinophagaceae bacterium]